MTAARTLPALLVAASASGCALTALTGDPSAASPRLQRATAALEAGEFGAAERDLRWLAARCEAGDSGRKALLLLAASQLDTGNPYGTPYAAAELAARYLRLPDARPEDLPVARSLYRLALDLGARPERPADPQSGLDDWGPLANRFEACGAASRPEYVWRSLPDPPAGSTTADRITALEDELVARTDSLLALERRVRVLSGRAGELDAAVERITALEAEIERIRELLKRPPLDLQPDAS